jgi:hypothetical protein
MEMHARAQPAELQVYLKRVPYLLIMQKSSQA